MSFSEISSSIGQKPAPEYRQVILGDVPVFIPWSNSEREMLFMQSASRVNFSDPSDDETLGIEKLNSRVTSILRWLIPILEKLPEEATIVDIGAGNSLIDIIINLKYPKKKFKFILVDSAYILPDVTTSKFYQDDYGTYNDWSFLLNAIELNNMSMSSFVTKEPDDTWSDTPVDLVFSIASWCWHYPVDTYIDKAESLVKHGGYLHVNSVLNVSKAFFKLTKCFKPIHLKTYNFIPSRSEVENSRSLAIMEQYNINPAYFSFVFTGKK